MRVRETVAIAAIRQALVPVDVRPQLVFVLLQSWLLGLPTGQCRVVGRVASGSRGATVVVVELESQVEHESQVWLSL